jgi:predicted RNA-binding protein YlqC (UPF0109 family)
MKSNQTIHTLKSREQNQGMRRLNEVAIKGKVWRNENDTMIHEVTDPVEEATDILRSLLDEMTDEPANVRINTLAVGMLTRRIQITATRVDYGNILGSSKSFLAAFQAIFRVLSVKHKVDIFVDLMPEIPTGEKQRRKFFQVPEEWPREKVEGLLQRVFSALFDDKAKVVISTAGTATAVEVFVDQGVNPHTVEWMALKMKPVVAAICVRNMRPNATLNVVQDAMLYAQVTQS